MEVSGSSVTSLPFFFFAVDKASYPEDLKHQGYASVSIISFILQIYKVIVKQKDLAVLIQSFFKSRSKRSGFKTVYNGATSENISSNPNPVSLLSVYISSSTYARRQNIV